MKKLRLEDLEVTTFETAAAEPLSRGTVAGHAKPTQLTCICPTTPQMDCTYGCSRESACPDNCIIISEADCLYDGADVTV